jgi:hypothetical protein
MAAKARVATGTVATGPRRAAKELPCSGLPSAALRAGSAHASAAASTSASSRGGANARARLRLRSQVPPLPCRPAQPAVQRCARGIACGAQAATRMRAARGAGRARRHAAATSGRPEAE